MLRGAIFDMDGVLVDNMEIHVKAFSEMARRYGVEFDYDLMMSMNGMGNGEFFKVLFPSEIVRRVGIAQLSDEKEALYRELYAPLLTPTPGLVELLDALKAAGVKIAVGSSAMKKNVDFVLDGLGIRRYFDALVNSDMVTRTKPDPEIYLVALKLLGLRGDECLVFEDAVAGIQAASGAGIRTVGVATTLDKETLRATPGVVLAVDNFVGLNPSSLNEVMKNGK